MRVQQSYLRLRTHLSPPEARKTLSAGKGDLRPVQLTRSVSPCAKGTDGCTRTRDDRRQPTPHEALFADCLNLATAWTDRLVPGGFQFPDFSAAPPSIIRLGGAVCIGGRVAKRDGPAYHWTDASQSSHPSTDEEALTLSGLWWLKPRRGQPLVYAGGGFQLSDFFEQCFPGWTMGDIGNLGF